MARPFDAADLEVEEKGYPWLHFSFERVWIRSLLGTLLACIGAGTFYFWYTRYAKDVAPDSIGGYVFALLGTTCLLLAGVLYRRQRLTRRRRAVGQLHAALHWHICFAVLGLFFLLMHSFGNFNLRSGTYALYGMIALVVSGAVGRILDQVLPRLIAQEANKALNAQGDDRIETISQKLEALVSYNTEMVGARSTVHLHMPWDLSYISLEATPQELSRNAPRYRFIPDKKSGLTRPGALMPGTQEQITALNDVQRALYREQVYRYMLRYWRKFHTTLALLTLGLTIWHLVYAAQLLLPVLLHR